MECPKCGYQRQTSDNAFTPATECPACGIIYSKHEHKKPAFSIGGTAPPSHIKPSPVDAVSLKMARERVERRLREQLERKVKDKRHEATLKLARRFASQAVLKRRESYQQSVETQKRRTEASTGQTAPDERAESISAKQATESQKADVSPPVKPVAADAAPEPQDMQSPSASDQIQQSHALQDPITAAKPDVMTETTILDTSDLVSPHLAAAADHQSWDASEKDDLGAETLDPQDQEAAVGNAMLANADSLPRYRSGGSMMRVLSSVAWLILLAGVIGAFLSWTTIRDAQAGVHIPVPSGLSMLPLGLLLGFAYLATGVLGFAFFWVSSMINRHLTDIRRLLMARTLPMGIVDDSDRTVSETN